MKNYWNTSSNEQAGFAYPLVLFLLMLWILFLLAGIEGIKIQREQVRLDKELYELNTLYQMTKESLTKERNVDSVQYHFPNGSASVQLVLSDEERLYYQVTLTTLTNGQAERDIILPRAPLDE